MIIIQNIPGTMCITPWSKPEDPATFQASFEAQIFPKILPPDRVGWLVDKASSNQVIQPIGQKL